MQRAAVLIGVKKTGNLPELQAVSSSVNAMALWAKAQGFDEKLVRVVSDDKGPVTAQQIKGEIQKSPGPRDRRTTHSVFLRTRIQYRQRVLAALRRSEGH